MYRKYIIYNIINTMEYTRNKLPEDVKQILTNLSDYLDTKLYFFGSVQRNDYYPGDSDIDVDIFTENEKTTLLKMRHFFHVDSDTETEKDTFKKVVWKLRNGRIVHGRKYMYKDTENKFSLEFSIYNEKYKTNVLEEHIRKTELPFFTLWFLIILKFLYYKLHFISGDLFKFLKNKFTNLSIGYIEDDKFIVLNNKPETSKKLMDLLMNK